MTRFVLFSERYIHISYIWCLSHVSKTSSGRGALRFLMLFFLIHIYLLFNNPQFISQKNCWQVSMYSHLQYKLDDTLFFLLFLLPSNHIPCSSDLILVQIESKVSITSLVLLISALVCDIGKVGPLLWAAAALSIIIAPHSQTVTLRTRAHNHLYKVNYLKIKLHCTNISVHFYF